MPLAEGGESISGDLKIDLRRLKNHSKQIDFSFCTEDCGGGEMACIQLFIRQMPMGNPPSAFVFFF